MLCKCGCGKELGFTKFNKARKVFVNKEHRETYLRRTTHKMYNPELNVISKKGEQLKDDAELLRETIKNILTNLEV
jgi:hypothetical protein